MRRAALCSLPCVFALLLAPGGALAGAPLSFSIDDAVHRALLDNAQLRVQRKEVDVAKAEISRSTAWFPSNPEATVGAQRTTQAGISSNYEILLSQEVELAGQRGARMSAAQAALEKARAEVKGAELALTKEVKSAFVAAQIAQERMRLAQENLDTSVQLTESLLAEPHTTDARQLDVNVAQIQATRNRRALAATEQAYQKALAHLRQLLALNADQGIRLVGAPQSTPRSLPPTANLVDRALRQRPDLAALAQTVRRSDDLLDLNRRQAIPNVTFSGGYSRFEGDTLVGGDISIPIPLFQRKSPDIAVAVSEREQAGIQSDALKERIRQEVLEARAGCAAAGRDLEAMQTIILPKSEQDLELERRQYDRGEVTVSELVGIQIDLATARGDYFDALQAYDEALFTLEAVIGGPL